MNEQKYIEKNYELRGLPVQEFAPPLPQMRMVPQPQRMQSRNCCYQKEVRMVAYAITFGIIFTIGLICAIGIAIAILFLLLLI
jgi:hypothetical protein